MGSALGCLQELVLWLDLDLRVVVGAVEVQVGLAGHWGVAEGDVLALVPVRMELLLADHQQENPVVVRRCVVGLCWAGWVVLALREWVKGMG